MEHPGNVYVAEDDVLPALDGWLAGLFEPDQIERTVTAMVRSQPDARSDPAANDAARVAAECDAKLARYRAALEAGTDPALVAIWTAEVQAHRAAALARVRNRTRTQHDPMNEADIHKLVEALGDVRAVLGRAATDDRAAVHRQLGLRLTYAPELRTVRAAIEISAHSWG